MRAEEKEKMTQTNDHNNDCMIMCDTLQLKLLMIGTKKMTALGFFPYNECAIFKGQTGEQVQ